MMERKAVSRAMWRIYIYICADAVSQGWIGCRPSPAAHIANQASEVISHLPLNGGDAECITSFRLQDTYSKQTKFSAW